MMKSRRQSFDASRRYHDRVARQYDAMYDDAYWEIHDRLTWDSIKPFLPRDTSARCCDLGCGTGKWGMKLLKSGFATTFVDHSAAMIEQARARAELLVKRLDKATFLVADMIDLPDLPGDEYELTLAMGDPLSICSDPRRAVTEMFRLAKHGGIVIATADNQLTAFDFFMGRGDIDSLEQFVKSGKTHWLTTDQREQFELTTFTPGQLTRLFERAGFTIMKMAGKTILPIREHRDLLKKPGMMDRLMRLERQLADDPTTAARASHLQIIVKKEIRVMA